MYTTTSLFTFHKSHHISRNPTAEARRHQGTPTGHKQSFGSPPRRPTTGDRSAPSEKRLALVDVLACPLQVHSESAWSLIL